jgi:hypothetical protein
MNVAVLSRGVDGHIIDAVFIIMPGKQAEDRRAAETIISTSSLPIVRM